MFSELLLPIGLTGLFTAILLLGLAVGLASVQRKETLDVLEAQAGRSVSLRDQSLSESFSNRALVPTLSRVRSAALRATPIGMRRRLQKKLMLAGSLVGWDAEKLASAKILIGLLTGFWGGFLAGRLHLSPVAWVGLVVVFAGVGFVVPDALLEGRIRTRQNEIRMALPDTIDLLSISVEAGLGFDAALAQSAKHIPGALSQELRRMLQEIQLGLPRAQAFRNMAERTDIEELNAFVLAMTQADVFGVSVANVLKAQARELRIRRRQRAEHQAMQVPVKILFPLVLCVLPALFVVVLGPGAIRIFQSLLGGRI